MVLIDVWIFFYFLPFSFHRTGKLLTILKVYFNVYNNIIIIIRGDNHWLGENVKPIIILFHRWMEFSMMIIIIDGGGGRRIHSFVHPSIREKKNNQNRAKQTNSSSMIVNVNYRPSLVFLFFASFCICWTLVHTVCVCDYHRYTSFRYKRKYWKPK